MYAIGQMKHYICTKERLFQEDDQEKEKRALVNISHDNDGLKLMLVYIRNDDNVNVGYRFLYSDRRLWLGPC